MMVDAPKIAKEAKVELDKTERGITCTMNHMNNHKRQPRLPPPEGGICLRQASRKYGVPNPTLSIWVKKGYIPILLRTKNELYVDESKLAELIRLYLTSPGQGKNTLKQRLKLIASCQPPA